MTMTMTDIWTEVDKTQSGNGIENGATENAGPENDALNRKA